MVKAVETLIETGDFSVGTIGDNLPNENEIHEKYGSKNFLFMGSKRALEEANGQTHHRRICRRSSRGRARRKIRRGSGTLLMAMHEVIGHGSGKLSEPKLSARAPRPI